MHLLSFKCITLFCVFLKSIISSFDDVDKVVLLAGDCVVSHDDARWQVGHVLSRSMKFIGLF
jgi:hypothetical protein